MTRLALRCMVYWILGAGFASAQDAISIEIHASATAGSEAPRVVFTANVDVVDLDVGLKCGGVSARHKGALSAGSQVELPLRAAPGSWPCEGSIRLELADGSMGEMPLDFEIHVLPKLEITVDRDSADLVAGHMDLSVNRDVRSFVVEAYGMDGMPIEAASHFMGAVAGTQSVALDWTPSTHEVLRFRVRVEDGSGFWAEKNLYPWFFEIPHEDVVFATNESKIRSSEMGKLRQPWEAIQETAARYGDIAPVNLFISGYTDTVGSRSSNQGLSERRARALAGWFRDQAFSGEIWYQGFGEDGQAVQTGDEVDNQANRRALYFVAADPPPRSRSLPGSSWKRL